MDIFLLDRNGGLVDLWQQYFSEDNVMPVRGFFDVFMDPYDVQCVVSPANSYGIMDGGYDGAITRYFGDGLQRCVQDHIINHYYGEQPVDARPFSYRGSPRCVSVHENDADVRAEQSS